MNWLGEEHCDFCSIQLGSSKDLLTVSAEFWCSWQQQRVEMGLSGRSGRVIVLNNWTLMFSDPQLEHDFKSHQCRVWASTELWRLKMNLLAGLINLSITSYLLSLVGTAPEYFSQCCCSTWHSMLVQHCLLPNQATEEQHRCIRT